MKFQPEGSTESGSMPEKVLETKPEEPSKSTSQFQVKDVPSQFKSYPKDIRIFADSYSYREIKFISDSQIPLDKQYEVMLQGITVEGMPVKSLTFFDFIYISVLRKLTSLGAQSYRAPYACSKCGGHGIHNFTLEDIGFKTLDVPALPVNINFNSLGKHSFSPLTVGSYMKLYKSGKLHIVEENTELLREDGIRITDPIAILSEMCVDLSPEEAYELLYDVRDPDDIELLEDLDDLLDHHMQPLEFPCNLPLKDLESGEHPSQVESCGKKIYLGLLGGESLIIPFREHESTTESRISFGS